MNRPSTPFRSLFTVPCLLFTVHCPLFTFSLLGCSALASYRLDYDTPVHPELQSALESIDARIAAELEIPADKRSCGVLDLTDLRLGMVNPDRMQYAASVPKICILLAYFETHPEAARDLDPAVERELQLMIKRSSNEMASKYSQQIGLEKIQELQQSDRYRLYDAARGGGIWSGKHYGIDRPRIGDPLGDLSHAATARSLLRYYLLLEQGRLVGPDASARMRRIFEAPRLDFHDDNFARGLTGRDLTMIRKNGLWENWHLDTARVEHAGRVYVLVGLTEHPRGREYLSKLAAAVDEHLCGPSRPAPLRHALRRFDLDRTLKPGEAIELGPIDSPLLFNEALPSWNVETPPGAGFTVEMRVAEGFTDLWSAYLFVGQGGEVPDVPRGADFEGGKIDVDYFRSPERWSRVQLRVRAFGAAPVRVARLAVCFSDMTRRPIAVRPPQPAGPPPDEALWKRRLAVPFRSQRAEDRLIADSICSPTSVAMMMEFRGVNRPTAEVAARIFDPVHKIYGNWPRAVQAAFEAGLPGYLERFGAWREVEASIARGQPLIISIRAAPGELRGAPYPKTDGHLLVLVGFDAEGNVEVNDPAAATAQAGQVTYRREDLEKVWFARGGTAYVIGERSP
jgi:beta-lactamase class A